MPSPFDPPTYGIETMDSDVVSPFDPPVYGIEIGDDVMAHDQNSDDSLDQDEVLSKQRERAGRQMEIDPDSENDLNQEEIDYLNQV
jgi:hypothetical protein